MSKIFLISGKGFFKEKLSKYEDGLHTNTLCWTSTLREAKLFSSQKQAKEFIENNQIEAFVWTPYAEEPIINKWAVKRRGGYYDIMGEEEHECLEWRAVLVIQESRTDVKYLVNKCKNIDENEYFTKEEAEKIAREKNLLILEEIKNKLKL